MNSTPSLITRKPPVVYALILGLLSIVVYFRLFSSGFISWDDGEVLLHNKDVQQFNIRAFFTNYYVGNYAPLTMLGFAIDWLLFHGQAAAHHGVSLLLHVVNAVLVYRLSKLFLKDDAKAMLCAVVFCFHPLQVETVAWVAAKNNILYTQFFLWALIFYSQYRIGGVRKYYYYTLLFFVASVLCKPSAITFPLSMLLVDCLLGDRVSWKPLLIRQLPFVIIAVVFGFVTIYTRTEDKFITGSHAYAVHERIGYAGYALLQYISKFLMPVKLSVIYPYPQHKLAAMCLGYFTLAALATLVFYFFKRNKTAFFGLLFFIANLLLVLQLLPFGEVLTADRYMYVPILGLSWALFSFLHWPQKRLQYVSMALALLLGTLTFARTAAWKNSIGLYTDIIDKYPHSSVALNSLGAEHMLNHNYDLSLKYLNAAIAENATYYKGYYNRGLLYAQTNRMQEAITDFTKAIELKQYPKAYVARANAYYTLHDYPQAIADAEMVLESDPRNIKALYVLATCYDDQNDLNQALTYYNQAIYLASDNPLFYLRRAILQGKMQNMKACLTDLETATTLDPNFAEAYYWKGVAKANLKENPCADLKKAVDMGFDAALPALKNYCR